MRKDGDVSGATISLPLARKVLETVDAGLVRGLGKPEPGQMCVEAAVCYALGQKHSDQPACVGAAVRRFKIALNDSAWSSNAARTKGMRRVAIAQLGSDTLDQRDFAALVAIGTVREILPTLPNLSVELKAECVMVTTLAEAQQVAVKVRRAAARAAYAAAAAAAAADAAAAAAAAADAADAAAYAAAERDRILGLAAEMAVTVLKQLKSPGAAFVDELAPLEV